LSKTHKKTEKYVSNTDVIERNNQQLIKKAHEIDRIEAERENEFSFQPEFATKGKFK
jgi:hypothetical protein